MTFSVRLFRSDRSCLLLIVAAGLLLCGTGLGARDFWDPDEPRTARVTDAVVRSGDWVVLRSGDRPYLEKPPLYFWLAAAASLPSGAVDEVTARLPASLSAIATAIVVFFLGRDLFGRRAGALSAIVFLTTFDIVLESHWARPDMLLACCLTVAALLFRQALASTRPRAWMAGFFLAVGLAILTKGPVGLIPVPAALAYLAAARRLTFLRRSGAAWGAVLALLPVSLWMAEWAARAGHPFPLPAALARFGERVAVGLHHPHSPAHIFASLPLALVPWIALLPAACVAIWPRRGEPRDERALFVLAFPLVYAALFAMATEKRGVYLLPIVPFQGLLIGRLWDQALFDWDPHPFDRPVRWGLIGGLLLACAGAAYALPRATAEDPALFAPGALLAAVAIGSALLPLLLQSRLGPGAAIASYAIGLVVSHLIVLIVVLPAVDRHKSARPLAESAAQAAGEAPLGLYSDDHPGFAWYARRPVVVIAGRDQLAAFFQQNAGAVCLIEETDWESERARLPPAVEEIERGRVGHRRFVLARSGAAP